MSKQQPLVSVLIANYNNGAYIEDAIKSVVNQTYNNCEIIIVDDASTDNSWDIIKAIEKQYPNIYCYRNNHNLKVAATKAKATQLARGEICAILDPDDALAPEAIDKHVQMYLKYDDYSLIGSNYYQCNELLQIKNVNNKIYQANAYPSYLASDGGIHHFWSFSKKKYQLTEGFQAEFILAEDQDLFYKLEEVGKVGIINEPLYYYREHQNALSQGDKIASAYAYHLLAMFAALNRRTKTTQESLAVKATWLHFMAWGITKINKPMRIKVLKTGLFCYPDTLINKQIVTACYGLFKTQ
jgi:glycosyltransferase involved in cell wall biosynthesis